MIFPIKDSWWYIQRGVFGWGEKGSQGAGLFTAPNPPFGATFTYYLKESLKTRKKIRQKEEGKLAKDGNDVYYPSWDALKAEDREEKPKVILTVRDEEGNVVRKVDGSNSRGVHRTTWDFRYPGFSPTDLDEDGRGPLVIPGKYTVSIDKWVDGVTTELVGPTEFEVVPLGESSLPAPDRPEVLAFQRQVGALQRAVMGANSAAGASAAPALATNTMTSA
jgi:hypothetical protein